MSDKEYLAKRFEESFRLGNEVGEMLANPKAYDIDMDGARAAVMQAENNLKAAVDAFTKRNQELFRWATEGWYHACGALDELSGAHWLHYHGVPEDIIEGVIEKIKAFREKCQSRSEKP